MLCVFVSLLSNLIDLRGRINEVKEKIIPVYSYYLIHPMYQISVKAARNENAEEHSYQVSKEKEGIRLNDAPFEWDMIQFHKDHFHILKNNRSYTAEIVKWDKANKTALIKINKTTYELLLKDKFDLLLEKMGMDKSRSAKVSEIKAPMPGLILDIKVEEGTEVKKGDALLILEAMKMENVLKSPAEGKVKKITVHIKDHVEKNQVLIIFE